MLRLTVYYAAKRNQVGGGRAAAAVLALGAVVLAALAPASHAQGGAPAPDFSEPCPAVYPGDGAGRERIARWMARGAAGRGLPRVLPVMAGIAESGLRNLKGKDYHGFFGMHRPLGDGDYRGFPDNPELQLRWFLDTAALVRRRRVAEGRPDPAADESAFGIWIADVERPARENRSLYQRHLTEARRLIDGRCSAPESGDTTPPRLRAQIVPRQRPLETGGIVLRVRCPDGDCLVGATAVLGTRTLRAAAIEPPESGYATLTVALPRAVRRELRAGGSVRARVTAIAADGAANTAAKSRVVVLSG